MLLDESKNPISSASIEVGCLSGFKPEPIGFYFDIIKKDYNNLKDCVLNVIEIDGRIKCEECGSESRISNQPILFCQKCESGKTKIINGKDINLCSIEVNK